MMDNLQERPVRHFNSSGRFIEQLESRTLLSVTEPNNTFATANILGEVNGFAGTHSITNAITATDPIDNFKIFTNAKGSLRIDLKGNTAVLKMTLVHDTNANGFQDAGEQISAISAIAGIGGSISFATSQALPIETYFI